jgi:phosphoglycolate phosphatase-like HAD superfamily hydrolase
MSQKILLFDMDGVLLEPGGYHKALTETVRLIGESLGYKNVELTPADIAAFEAAGITSEWDSSALCFVWLMLPLWERFPSLGIPATLTEGLFPREHGLAPEWEALFDKLNQPPSESGNPIIWAAQTLASGHPREQFIRQILRDAYSIEKSLTYRIFQELVLGSPIFAETYSLLPWFKTESFLSQFDRPNLTSDEHATLLNWLAEDGHQAAIFTNRPSRHGGLSTPEAEIGAQCVGLATLPIVGYGDMLWLSQQRGVDVGALRKPSPAHTLAALLRARGVDAETALYLAADLALDGRNMSEWHQFQSVDVHVFEDTSAGLMSAQAAQGILQELGLNSFWHFYGISAVNAKQAALRSVGAEVFPSLPEALMAGLVRGSLSK